MEHLLKALGSYVPIAAREALSHVTIPASNEDQVRTLLLDDTASDVDQNDFEKLLTQIPGALPSHIEKLKGLYKEKKGPLSPKNKGKVKDVFQSIKKQKDELEKRLSSVVSRPPSKGSDLDGLIADFKQLSMDTAPLENARKQAIELRDKEKRIDGKRASELDLPTFLENLGDLSELTGKRLKTLDELTRPHRPKKPTNISRFDPYSFSRISAIDQEDHMVHYAVEFALSLIRDYSRRLFADGIPLLMDYTDMWQRRDLFSSIEKGIIKNLKECVLRTNRCVHNSDLPVFKSCGRLTNHRLVKSLSDYIILDLLDGYEMDIIGAPVEESIASSSSSSNTNSMQSQIPRTLKTKGVWESLSSLPRIAAQSVAEFP